MSVSRPLPSSGSALLTPVIAAVDAWPVTASPYLTASAELDGEQVLLRVRGDLDLISRQCLHDAVGAVLDRYRPHVLVMDLSGLTFADCAGLSVIVSAHRRQAGRGHHLVIKGVQPIVHRLLNVTGLSGYLHLCPPGQPGQASATASAGGGLAAARDHRGHPRPASSTAGSCRSHPD